jgi:LacI family transcriptional regulator
MAKKGAVVDPHDIPQRGVASIRDVATLAGVAVSSVSRVLAGHPDVSGQMRARVLRAVEESGYAPNSFAQGLRRGTSMSIGFVVGDISNALMAQIALAAETRLAAESYSLLLANSHDAPERDLANIQVFRQRLVDGLLLSLTDEREDHLAGQLRLFNKPTVLLDRDAGAPDASKVLFDHAVGFRVAADHLIALGHRRIALIAGSPSLRHTRERQRAVREALSDAGLPEPTVSLGSLGLANGQTAVEGMLRQRWRPTAIICGGNQLLPGVLVALRNAGLSIPGDMSLITTDATDLAAFHSPPLACVTRDAAAFGTAAGDAMLRRLAGQAPDVTVLPTAFQSAPSCARPPGASR